MGKAIYAGSWDPFHRGHLNIAYKASTIFDELYIVIARNADKPDSHTSIETIKKDLKLYTVCNAKVVELPPNELLVDFAEQLGIGIFVRGVRGPKDFASEFEMADINKDLGYGDIETVFLTSDLVYRHISSSLVRSLVGTVGWKNRMDNFLPEHSEKEFIQRNSK